LVIYFVFSSFSLSRLGLWVWQMVFEIFSKIFRLQGLNMNDDERGTPGLEKK